MRDLELTGAPHLTTFNRMGRTESKPNEYSLAFIQFAKNCKLPVLDIGAAYGVTTVPTLLQGATVIANDLDPRHLDLLTRGVPQGHRHRLICHPGRFPGETNYEASSLNAIHASNMLHFLAGEDIEYGVAKMYKWLISGGKVFTISGTPYVGTLTRFIPVYEMRKKAGINWPGEVTDMETYSDHPVQQELPSFMNHLDDTVLTRVFRAAGFRIDKAEMYRRKGLPSYLCWDGRENVGLIATKP